MEFKREWFERSLDNFDRAYFERLCEGESSPFYKRDTIGDDGQNYTIFSYRMASYSAWLQPYALDCRGIMFRGNELVSLPPEKFFNVEENPLATTDLFYHDCFVIMEKADGSLISTFIDANNQLRVKSKTSLDSDQANLAQVLLNQIRVRNPAIARSMERIAMNGNTFNFELVGPGNPIVMGYPENQLVLLNVRSHQTGHTYLCDEPFLDEFIRLLGAEQSPYIRPVRMFYETVRPFPVFEEQTFSETNHEGYVVVVEKIDGGALWLKIKTKWYLNLHRLIYNQLDEKNVLKMIVDGVIDDTIYSLKELGAPREFIQGIILLEDQLSSALHRFIHRGINFYDEHKEKTRKDFAILAKETFRGQALSFSFAMWMFQNGAENPDEFIRRMVNSESSRQKFLDQIRPLDNDDAS